MNNSEFKSATKPEDSSAAGGTPTLSLLLIQILNMLINNHVVMI